MAKKFRFSMEKLIEIRIDKEEESRKLYLDSKKEMDEAKEKLNDLLGSYEKYNGINKGESLVYQKIKKNYLTALNRGIEETEKDLEKKSKITEFRRIELTKRQVERKTVDKLKEKKYKEHIEEVKKDEQLKNDEFGLFAYYRNSRKEVTR